MKGQLHGDWNLTEFHLFRHRLVVIILAIIQSSFARLKGERFLPLSALLVKFSFCADGQMVNFITISVTIENWK